MDSRMKQPRRKTATGGLLRRHANKLLAGAFLALLIHGIVGPHGAIAVYRTKNELRQLQDEIRRLNEENQKLAGQVKALKNDPTAIERIARDQMGLARPGELVFKVPAKPAESPAPAPPPK